MYFMMGAGERMAPPVEPQGGGRGAVGEGGGKKGEAENEAGEREMSRGGRKSKMGRGGFGKEKEGVPFLTVGLA